MAGYATRTRRNADAAQKAPPKVFAREDADGVRREKKRRADRDAPAVPGEASADGRALSKEERRAAKKARKAEKSGLLAQVMGARGTAPENTDVLASANPGRSDRAAAETAPSSSKPSTANARGFEPKPRKSYGCKELDDFAKYFASLGGPPLFPGWKVERHVRGTDKTPYHYLINPQGVRFRSRKDAARHYGFLEDTQTAKGKPGKGKQTKNENESRTSGQTKETRAPALAARGLNTHTTAAAPLADADERLSKKQKKEKKKKKKKKKKKDKRVNLERPAESDGKGKALSETKEKKKKPKTRSMESYWEQVKVCGEVFRRGDCAYVISDKARDLDEDAEEICAACGTTHGVGVSTREGDDDAEADVMLECDGCLRGWHLGCLTPPLAEVPEAEWMCPLCLASEDGVAAPDARARKRTACSEFLDGRLHLCRIECIWSEGGEFKFTGRWFATPEETHTGRRSHHARREVFLTDVTDENNVESLLQRATVLPPQQFRDAARHAAKAASAARRRALAARGLNTHTTAAVPLGDDATDATDAKDAKDVDSEDDDSVDAAAVAAARAAGEDVFLCEYTYDAHFQRFKRRVDWEEDTFSDDEGRGRSGRLARGEDRYLDDYALGEEEDSEGDAEDADDGGEWREGREGGSSSARKNKKNKRPLSRGKNKNADAADKRRRGRAVSRHIAASRRKAAAASGEAGVMGLGAMAVRRVEREAPATKLGRARLALSLATTPGSLPCREAERGKIYDFVEQAINEGVACRGRSVYISGVPGTGKTATVREVIRALRKKSRDGYLPRFNHVELNGLRLQTPAHAYSAIAEELLGERLSPHRACEVLDARFKEGRGGDGRVTILVADEMDLLVTRSQQLLYNLFDWPTHRASRLVILGIANTLDLPERLLPKISSRLGNNKVVFKPYTADQLKKIVCSRLEEAAESGTPPKDATNDVSNSATGAGEEKKEAFEAVAIELASRKVAAVSGDARRVLELCRRAAELAETLAGRSFDEKEAARLRSESAAGSDAPAIDLDAASRRRVAALDAAQVVMRHIKDAMFEMFQSPHMRMLEAASRHDRIFLCALLLELRRSGVTEACVSHVMRTHEQLCRTHAEPLPPAGAAAAIACRLAASGLLLADPGRRRAAQRVCLNVPLEDVVYALKDERRVQERKVAAASARGSAPLGHADADRGDIKWMRSIEL